MTTSCLPLAAKCVHPAAVAAGGWATWGDVDHGPVVSVKWFPGGTGNPDFLPLQPQQRPVPCSHGQVSRWPSGSPWPGSARLFMASQEPGLGSRWTLLRDELPACLWVTHCFCLMDSWGRGKSGCSPRPTCPAHHLIFSLPVGCVPKQPRCAGSGASPAGANKPAAGPRVHLARAHSSSCPLPPPPSQQQSAQQNIPGPAFADSHAVTHHLPL